MANIANRSPWVIQVEREDDKKFRLKGKAEAYVAENNLSRAAINKSEK
jgi:hypothetical protein